MSFWQNYWEDYLEPIKYTDDVYHIGTKNGPSWLIKSTDGLILLDTSMPKNLYHLIININKLGFNIYDVKHILHSHGHIDHIGGTRAIKELTGAKTYIGEGDADMVRGVNGLQWTNEFGMKFDEAFEPDVIIKDGDKITIGDKTFEFINCPGHTQGTLTLFFNCTDKGKSYKAGMFGGGGLLSMRKTYLDKYGLPHSLRSDFIKSIDKVYDLVPEVHLGNHLGDNKHREKITRLGGEQNPFIDGSTWKWFLDKRKAEAIAFFKEDE